MELENQSLFWVFWMVLVRGFLRRTPWKASFYAFYLACLLLVDKELVKGYFL